MTRTLRLLAVCLLGSLVLSLCTQCGAGPEGATSAGPQDGEKRGATLVIYYSVTGNTELVARTLAQSLGADVVKVEDAAGVTTTKLRDTAGYKELAATGWPIKPVSADLSKYSRVFIGSPLWHGQPSSVIFSFVDQADLAGKTAIVFLTMGGESPGSALETFSTRVRARSATVPSSFAITSKLGRDDIIAKTLAIAAGYK